MGARQHHRTHVGISSGKTMHRMRFAAYGLHLPLILLISWPLCAVGFQSGLLSLVIYKEPMQTHKAVHLGAASAYVDLCLGIQKLPCNHAL